MKKFCGFILVLMLFGCTNTNNSEIDDVWTDMKTVNGPTPIIKITPRYPADLINKKLSGVVILEFIIDESGKPVAIKAINEPNDALKQEAVYTLRKNIYHPKHAGEKVVVEAIFHLTMHKNEMKVHL